MRAFFISIIVAFLSICGICYFLDRQYFATNSGPVYSFKILLVANTLLALLSIGNYLIVYNASKNKNPNALVRAKTSGMMLKFFVSIAALLAYIFINNRIVHKPSIYVFFGMYIIYMIIETIYLTRIAKAPNT